ncbi:uncharacterized protein HMPREF1541_01790 [Cyphellophora europaea CBS 101466]|uniref:Thioredoxin domain-containing protein n=1 Tax=Cyphellophora europaea (strain CBS 101466) TaxID=1220924 RepID=W2S3L5_CYPE1|nr:uncharacterized protein HMPREF1541_01790 [Cyphellophora europaea CBS 101466]ETN42633.1 hypothetical protein HMPREF1541_01790 [Cyphellophora europaea CBS 101466]
MRPRQVSPFLQILSRPGLSIHFRSTHAFSTTSSHQLSNRVYNPIRTPPQFHDYLRTASASNTLLLLLFTTSACAPCRTITPLLTELVTHRSPSPSDRFSALSFAEVELDSADTSNGNITDLGVEYGITSMPTLVGFGGRRAERVTERLVDTRLMSDRGKLGAWVDEVMEKGDPNATGGTGGKGAGLLSKLFG